MGSALRRGWCVGVSVAVLAACTGDDGGVAEPTGTTASSATTATSATSVTDGAATTSAGSDPSPAEAGVEPEGFTTITARITEADGEVCEVCVWLADTVEERGRGLMGVTDLGDAEGMVFRFDEPVVNSFFMRDTPTPLSIAWFSPSGDYAASTDMEPCLEIPEDGCPLSGPGVQYELALEVFRGGLVDLGVGPGSRLELLDGTEADRCP
jgi:uncharacterized membrane protein (UPF0127 family)